MHCNRASAPEKDGTRLTRILIADDHDVVRSGLRSILEAHPNWEVVAEASDGKEAILKAIEAKPDVAVLDYSLPLVNGVEATRQIRGRLPKTEVLIFTMHDNEALIEELLKAGARGYLLKIDANRYNGWNWDNIRNDHSYGTESNTKVWVMREFLNSDSNHLGMPLPKGRIRFYRRDTDGRLEFTGEDAIDHTAKDEKVRVFTGSAFDLTGERAKHFVLIAPR